MMTMGERDAWVGGDYRVPDWALKSNNASNLPRYGDSSARLSGYGIGNGSYGFGLGDGASDICVAIWDLDSMTYGVNGDVGNTLVMLATMMDGK